MKIIHSIDSNKIEKEISNKENVGFLLSNGLGGFAAFNKANNSRYNGWFVSLNNKLYKILDEIKLIDSLNTIGLKNEFYKAGRVYEGELEDSMFVPRERNSLVYELNKEAAMEIVLDVRESYDARNFGRVYEISEEDGLVFVKYAKYRNWEEDKSDGKEYEIYIAINPNGGKVEKIGEWAPKHYTYDQKRMSHPYDKYVYRALRISAKKVVFSVALSKKTAKTEALATSKKSEDLLNKDKKRIDALVKETKDFDKKTNFSVVTAKNSLDNLIVRDGKRFGVFAGLPWFFQFWTSDEAISLKSVSKIDKALAKKILMRDIGYINGDGKMYDVLNAKETGQYTLNMDAAGWLFKRAQEMGEETVLDKKTVVASIVSVIENIRKNYFRDGFVRCEAGETWMDTFYAGDIRDGARIEIQALMLFMYKEAFRLTGDEKYRTWELEFKNNVRKKFWNGKTLADGLNDFTIRPNIFIAHYIYPDLLAKTEWKECFKEALAHLWLGWGGVATIDKTSFLFYNEHTGETPESYHRGDSWYWINNLAALALFRTDKYIFKDYIEKIIHASSEELLWHGTVGCMSELSSAKEQRSEGAWSQAWSMAMYMEAMEEIMKLPEEKQEFIKVHFEPAIKKDLIDPKFQGVKSVKSAEKLKPAAVSDQRSSGFEPNHRNIMRVYELILAIVLLFSISIALGAAAFAASL